MLVLCEDILDERCHCGLAVRSRNADEFKVALGVGEPGCAEQTVEFPCIGNDDLLFQTEIMVGNNAYSTVFEHFFGSGVSVKAFALYAYEYKARFDFFGVVGDAENVLRADRE